MGGSLRCVEKEPHRAALLERSCEMPRSVAAQIAFYSALGLCFFALLASTLMAHPLFPFRMDDVDWTAAWLLTTVGDFYTSTWCLCGVIIATDGVASGGLWSLAISLLGSPFACAWVSLRLHRHHSLRCVEKEPHRATLQHSWEMPRSVAAQIGLYSALGLCFFALLACTLMEYPLFPFRMDDVGWTAAWLPTTVADYYVSTWCLCGVIIASDGAAHGMMWAFLTSFFGSPFACAWIVLRVRMGNQLKLMD